MSNSVTPGELECYIDDLIDSAGRVLNYMARLGQVEFFPSGLNYDATLRNRLIHGYLDINNDTVCSIITVDIPTLLARLQALKYSSN